MSIAYALYQLSRARQDDKRFTQEENDARRDAFVARWTSVVKGMSTGKLNVGSRTPTSYPEWVTPEVAWGGFATGNVIAALKEGERSNDSYLTAAGLDELSTLIESQKYSITSPEHAALPIFVYLLRNGHQDAAESLITTLLPHFDSLRFYPLPATHPITVAPTTSAISVSSMLVGLTRLEAMVTNLDIKRCRNVAALASALTTIHPWKRRIIEHFAALPGAAALAFEAVDPDARRRVPRYMDGRCSLVAGGDAFTLDTIVNAEETSAWGDASRALWAEWDAFVASDSGAHHLSLHARELGARRPSHTRWLLDILQTVATVGISALTAREIGRIRVALAGSATLRGAPRSAAFDEWWRCVAAMPLPDVRPAVATVRAAVDGYPTDTGLASDVVDTLIAHADVAPHAAVVSLLERARRSTVADLIARGTLTSAEAVAAVVTPVLSAASCAPISDPVLRSLAYASRNAFASRRGLLLLTTEGQVKHDDLPWVRAIGPLLPTGAELNTACRAVLADTVRCVLQAFPSTIFPNKFLQCIRDLARAAAVQLLVTEELAADLFRFVLSFNDKFATATVEAAVLLQGTVYERYYDLAATYAAIRERGAEYKGTDLLESMEAALYNRSEISASNARSGAALEYAMILHTHTLAGVVTHLPELRESIDFRAAARRCADTIASDTALIGGGAFMTRLRRTKDIGYAVRQLVFLLSFLPQAEAADVVESLEAAVSGKVVPSAALPEAVATHARRVLVDNVVARLREAVADPTGTTALPHEPLYGWNPGPPLVRATLLPPRPDPADAQEYHL